MKKWLRYLKITAATIGLLVLLVITACVTIVYFYEDDIIKYALNQIQKQINTDVNIEKVDLTIISTFPDASLVFTNISANEALAKPSNKALFKFEKLKVSFNIWDIFASNYTIKKVHLENGKCNIKVFEDGTDNFHFWKTKSDSTSGGKFSFNLNKVSIKDVSFQYLNLIKKADVSCFFNHLSLQGRFSEKNFDLAIYTNTNFQHITFEKVNYLKQDNVSLDLLINVENNELFNVKRGNISLANQYFSVTGNLNSTKSPASINLSVSGNDLRLEKVLDFVPTVYQNYWKDYEFEGAFYFNASIKGKLDNRSSPRINATFGINNGYVKRNESKIELKNVGFTGKYDNGEFQTASSSSLMLKDFTFTFAASKVNGYVEIIDFAKPKLKFNTQASLDIKKWFELFPLDTIENIEGQAQLNFNFESQLECISKFSPSDFIKSTSSGTLKITDGLLKLKNSNLPFSAINGDFAFNNNDVTSNNFSGIVGQSDFAINGDFKNFLSFLFIENQKLIIRADVRSKNINLNELLSTDGKSKNNNSYNLSISDNFDIDVSTYINNIQFRKFIASEIHGQFSVRNKKCILQDVSMNSMDGAVLLNAMIDDCNPKDIRIICDGKINRVNIQKMFYQFEDFGQNSLKSENIKGTLNSTIQFSALLNNKLEIDPASIKSNADITIDKGELINYEALNGLSKFVNINELKNVKFSTLKNTIQIQDKAITIPRMDIKSNAMDITLAGTHSFDNNINYRVELLLSAILSKKAKSAKKENEEFGVEIDDGLGKTKLFVKIFGTTANPQYSYDRQGLKQKLKTDIKTEKQNLKQILNEEFGWFKKDSTIPKNNTTNSNNNKKKEKKKDEEIEDQIKIEW
ncbi:MAG: AsmA-like C-terminal region-containing protein [Bacteroidota bacterium]